MNSLSAFYGIKCNKKETVRQKRWDRQLWKTVDLFLSKFLYRHIVTRKYLIFSNVEARGVEPLFDNAEELAKVWMSATATLADITGQP